MTMRELLQQNPDLGKEIVATYRYIEQAEGKHGRYPSNIAKIIVNKVKRIRVELGEEATGQFSKNLIELENELAAEGTFSSITTNLGVRIDLHIIIQEHNLFGRDWGWIYTGDLQHRILGGKAICGSQVRIGREPEFALSEGWPVCKTCYSKTIEETVASYRKEFNITDEQVKRMNGKFESSKLGIIMDFNSNPPKVEYMSRVKFRENDVIVERQKFGDE